jgi:sugar lactone lactonase YvrE
MMPTIRMAAALAILSLMLAACDAPVSSLDNAETTDELSAKKPAGTPGAAGLQLAEGEAAIVFTFPDPALGPEGIAFDRQGNMYVTNRLPDGVGGWTGNRVDKITTDGTHSVLAYLTPGEDCPGARGALGLTTDAIGNVYAAVGWCTSRNGVLIVRRDGAVEHVAGSEAMIFPNALTFDARGNLYVSDSFGGAIYRYSKDGSFDVWSTSDLLAPDFTAPLPFGVNGIAFDAPNVIYAANTVRHSLVRIPILPDGSAGEAEAILGTGPMAYLLMYPDGIALDADGMIYAAMPAAGTPAPPGVPIPPGGFPPMAPVIKVNPSTGMVSPVATPIVVGGPGSELFDTQTSLAFGTGPRHRKSVFVVSGNILGSPTGSGPVITQVGAGTVGAMGR